MEVFIITIHAKSLRAINGEEQSDVRRKKKKIDLVGGTALNTSHSY
jgi:hypothetical protein